MRQLYTYAEPDTDTREVFLDMVGEPFLSRDEAITSNIKKDLIVALREQLARAWPDDAEARDFVARALTSQLGSRASRLKEIVRALIEGTD